METYVIRIAAQPEKSGETSARELRGLIEHVGSGSRQPFADTRELLAILRAESRATPKEVER